MIPIGESTDLQAAERELDLQEAAIHERQKEIAAERHRRLDGEHRDLMLKCREAKEHMQTLRCEADALLRQFIQAQGAFENARNAVGSHRENRPNADDFPTSQEVALWRAELEQRDSAAREAEKEFAAVSSNYQLARVAWQNARDAFDRLRERESELRAQLTPPRRSGSTGITIEVFDGASPIRIERTA